MQTSLAIGIFFELFWLDLFPAGTFIPPHAPAATLASLALASRLGSAEPRQVLLALLLGLPMAWLGARMDQVRREFENRNYNRILQDARKPQDFRPERVVLSGLAILAAGNFILFRPEPGAAHLAGRAAATELGQDVLRPAGELALAVACGQPGRGAFATLAAGLCAADPGRGGRSGAHNPRDDLSCKVVRAALVTPSAVWYPDRHRRVCGQVRPCRRISMS